MSQTATSSLKSQLKPKLAATAVHLSFSIVIFAILGYQIYNYWYPVHHFYVDGGIEGIRIVFFCDVVLGPFLTFLIFNNTKARKLLVMDLAVISTVQIIALVWGAHIVYHERPLGIVEQGGMFHGITTETLEGQGAEPADLVGITNKFPVVLASNVPGMDKEELMKLMSNDTPFFLMIRFMGPFKDFGAETKQAHIDISAMAERNPAVKKRLDHFLETRGGAVDDYYYARYFGRYGLAIIVFTKQGDLIDYLGRPQ